MAKITLPSLLSGFKSVATLSQALQDIATQFNDKVLYRDNPSGEVNTMLSDFDMNGKRIINLPDGATAKEPITKAQLDAAASLTVSDAATTDYTANGTGAVKRTVKASLDDDISILDFGAKGDGIADDGPAIRAALTEGKARKRRVIAPFGTYLVNSVVDGVGLDVHQVEFVGQGISPAAVAFNKGETPILVQGINVQDFIRVGQGTDAAGGDDRSVFENFIVDGSNAPKVALPAQGARGVFCKFGVLERTIRNILVRANRSEWAVTNQPTVTEAKDANYTAFDLHLETSANSGLYYNWFDNLEAFNCYRGFWTDGDAGDGMRVTRIGSIRIWNCVQSITIQDAEVNDIALLAINSFIAGLDPSGKFPANLDLPAAGEMDQWGIVISRGPNTIHQIYIEGSPTSPVIFSVPENNFLNVRNASGDPDRIQYIFNGKRVTSSTNSGNTGIYVLESEALEVGSIAGINTQESLLPNGQFLAWNTDTTNITDGADVAFTMKARVEGTGRLDIIEETTLGTFIKTGGRSAQLNVRGSISAVEVDKVYGIKADLFDHYKATGTSLNDILTMSRFITVFVWVRPPAAKTKFHLSVSDGVITKTKDIFIDDRYIDAPAGNDDSLVVGQSGDFHVIPVQFDYSGGSKIEIITGVKPQSTTDDIEFYIDQIGVIAGQHSIYGCKPRITPATIPALVETPVNTNTIPATSDRELLFTDKDGTLIRVAGHLASW